MTLRPLFAIAAVLAFLVAASAASAGTYVVQACGSGNNSSWSLTSSTSELESGQTCPSTSAEYGGLWVRDRLASPPPFTDGTSRGWQFTAPAGLSVSAVTSRHWLYKEDDEDLKPELRTATGVLASCAVVIPSQNPCSSGSLGGGSAATYTGLSTPSLWIGVRCETGDPMVTCATGGTIHAARAVLYSASVTVNDPSAPTIGAVTGSLAGGAWRRGTQTLGIASASDAAGIRRLRVFQNGTLRGELPRSCDFTLPRPCSDAPSGELVSVDTTAIADGERQLEVGVFDAAENETRTAPVTARVDNTPPSAPTALTIEQGAVSSSSSVDATWSLPGGQASPIAESRWELCNVATSACTTGSTTSTSLSQAVGEGRFRLRVWLADEAGNAAPSSAAEREVLIDRTAPSAPEGLTSYVGPGDRLPIPVTASWALPTDGGSAIAASLWEVCGPAGCTRGETSATTFSFPAEQTGTYVIRVWLRDSAGNVLEATAASTTATVQEGSTTPPAPSPTPAATPTPTPMPTPSPTATPAPTPTVVPSRPSVRVESVSARRARDGRVTVKVRGRLSVTRGKARIRVQIGARTVTRTVTAPRGSRRLSLDLRVLAPRGTRAIVRVTPVGGRQVSRSVSVRKAPR